MRSPIIIFSAATIAMLVALGAASAQGPSAQAPDYDTQLRAITRGQPQPVVAFIQRKSACDHWAGEEPYDKARAAEMARAERRLRCAALDHDEFALRHRYRPNSHVLRALDALRRLDGDD
jgi:hypothetical protein